MEKYGKKVQQLPVEDEEILNSLARLARCCQCGAVAVWRYDPVDERPEARRYFCDEHVSRGCSCQEFDNLPCVEYWLCENGFELQE